ncbi:polysaccharide biosynthesis/export family protein [Mucilaginibacter pedocola]|uniref:Uncharacterized protein n=1 Tax=Mucilaginibacter pedocola TaxID=1792845 RepID=A0A1S9P7X9_9SPHI|nr:polysaccharide biosynthesis/export family protein [Mucilaginibacter pedocola]OOQ57061.1 hypothetical protein BC343_16145 [Mucilaginibacter pedocola]
MKKKPYSLVFFLLALVVLSVLGSCSSSKKLAYFNNVQRDTTYDVDQQRLETKINVSDILQINISTPDQITTAILNSSTAQNTGQQGGYNGYLVDESGMIKLPLIGSVKAVGLTKAELASSISEALLSKQIAKMPIVNVRIVNFKITVLGEVNHPGIVQVPNEHITLPEALAQSGDLTAYGRRNNVLLIREKDGKRITKRFSLNDSQLFEKDIYNLQNQDIIYIEPNNARAASADRSTQLIPYAFSAVSLLIVIYLQFIKN